MLRAALILALLDAAGCAGAPVASVAPVGSQPAGRVDLVESAPVETNLDHADIPDAYQVWPEMIAGASRRSTSPSST